MDPELKRRKEAFVSGHTGTTMLEVSLVSSVCPILMLLSRCVFQYLVALREAPRAPSHRVLRGLVHAAASPSPWARYTIDFATVVPGTIAAVLCPPLGIAIGLAALAAVWHLLRTTAALGSGPPRPAALFPGSTDDRAVSSPRGGARDPGPAGRSGSGSPTAAKTPLTPAAASAVRRGSPTGWVVSGCYFVFFFFFFLHHQSTDS
jgi:hypothetical protein